MDAFTIAPLQLDQLIARLTPRQMQIGVLLIEGKTGGEIATILSISRGAIKQHIRRMCWKVDVENRVQLIVLLVRWQVIQELRQ